MGTVVMALDTQTVRKLNADESFARFDSASQYFLGISGQDLLDRIQRDDVDDIDPDELASVTILLPFHGLEPAVARQH